jgi:hypothetical protein
MPPRSALNQRGRNRRMAGLSAIAAGCAGRSRAHRIRRLIFDVDAFLVVVPGALTADVILAPPRWSLGRQGPDVEPLAKKMNAFQIGEPLDQPADPVVDRKPGLVGRWMAVAAAPAADRLLERRSESAFSASLHSWIGRHATDSKSDNADVRLSEIMAMANRLAGCHETAPDSQVYLDGEVRRVFAGIDIDIGELLLARSLGVDGVIAHHPIGSRARLGLPEVIERHEGQMTVAGIPKSIAHEMMLARQRPVAHGLHAANYDRAVDAARLLKMPAMNIHLAASLVQPELWLGSPQNPVGRWVVQMAAGTNGGAPVYRTYYEHGYDTILAMHIDERDLRELEQLQRPGANLVITGHMPSDSIGMNRILGELEQLGIEVIAGSGVIRV